MYIVHIMHAGKIVKVKQINQKKNLKEMKVTDKVRAKCSFNIGKAEAGGLS